MRSSCNGVFRYPSPYIIARARYLVFTGATIACLQIDHEKDNRYKHLTGVCTKDVQPLVNKCAHYRTVRKKNGGKLRFLTWHAACNTLCVAGARAIARGKSARVQGEYHAYLLA